MKDIIMRNANGGQLNVTVIRYFRLNGVEYLIFSLNEVDEGGYVKLYVSKVNEGVGKTIEDDVEWNLIKDTIKTVIKSNKDNLPLPITDLNVNKIQNLQIMDQKIFKLNDSLLQLLSANKKEEMIDSFSTPVESQESTIGVMPVEEQPVLPEMPNPSDVFVNPTFSPVQNVQPATEINSFNVGENPITTNDPVEEYALDYKTLYENELKKNEELTQELEKLRNTINNLKNILNENF